MNINAKQIQSFDFHSLDMTTALSYFGQIVNILNAQPEPTPEPTPVEPENA